MTGRHALVASVVESLSVAFLEVFAVRIAPYAKPNHQGRPECAVGYRGSPTESTDAESAADL